MDRKLTISERLNWKSSEELARILEDYGFAINPNDSFDDLKSAILANIEDGTIPASAIDSE